MQVLVVGAGVVGLAIARQAAISGHDVTVAEITGGIANGVSSRNSEVIHAGLYYPTDTLRAVLCVRGRRMLYEFCASHGVNHHKCGKLVVATNEAELDSLYETADFDTALNALRQDARLAVITRSEKGCLVVTREATEAIPAVPVERVVDATGAGDLFAAGFLVGLARAADFRTAARLGALAAAEVIGHLGARPETSLKALAEQNGLGL